MEQIKTVVIAALSLALVGSGAFTFQQGQAVHALELEVVELRTELREQGEAHRAETDHLEAALRGASRVARRAREGRPGLEQATEPAVEASAEEKAEAIRELVHAPLDQLARGARVVPNFTDGRINGFKLFAIRRASPLRTLGFRNNDVVTSINGRDLSRTEEFTTILEEVRTHDQWTVDVFRDDEWTTLTAKRPVGI